MKSETDNKSMKKTTLLAIVLIPLLVAIGVVSGYYFTSADHAEGETVFAKEQEEVSVPLDEFLVNVGSAAGRTRYVRMEITLAGNDEDFTEVIDANLAKIRDTVIYALYTQTSESVFGEKDGSFALKNLLKERINQTLGEEMITDIYITNVVMQ